MLIQRLVWIIVVFNCFFSQITNAQSISNFKNVPVFKEKLSLTISVANNLNKKEKDNLECLAWNLYFEARGGTMAEKIAITYIPINRLNDPRFTNDICENVFQYLVVKGKKVWQFSWARRRLSEKWKLEEKAWTESQEIAYKVMQGHLADPSNGAKFFHHLNANLGFIPRSGKIQLGSHYFYR